MLQSPKEIELVITLWDIIFDIATMDIIVIKEVFNCITVFKKTFAMYLIFNFCTSPAIIVAMIIIIPGLLIHEKHVVDELSPV